MKCALFDYIRATSVEEVVTTLAGCDGDARSSLAGRAWYRYWPCGWPGRPCSSTSTGSPGSPQYTPPTALSRWAP